MRISLRLQTAKIRKNVDQKAMAKATKNFKISLGKEFDLTGGI